MRAFADVEYYQMGAPRLFKPLETHKTRLVSAIYAHSDWICKILDKKSEFGEKWAWEINATLLAELPESEDYQLNDVVSTIK
jgi:hypothetical protein